MKGIAASPGIAIGKVLIKKEYDIKIEKTLVGNIDSEVERLRNAREEGRKQIEGLYRQTLESIGESEAQIFQAHLMMLDDPEFFGQVEETIKSEGVNAQYALKTVTDNFIMIFESMDNEYMRERAADVKDVSDRITKLLLGIQLTDFSHLNDEVIIAARDLTPSDTAQMDKKKVIGFITDLGGRTAHSAIMARTLEIPAVVGLQDVTLKLNDGDMVVMDGEAGQVIINPSEDVIEQYRCKKQEVDEFKKKLCSLKGVKSVTKDGVHAELAANIGTPDDIDGVLRNDAEGIGLYRTEFLYMDRDRLPNEEEQFESYKIVAEKMEGKPVVIRTLDIGGDKELSYLKFGDEMNPFLGYRAIRLCLDRVDIFKTQLRALLRASAYGNIRIMFPMISSVEELREAKKIIGEVKEDLRKEGKKFNENVQVGMMIEIPSTAVISDLLAKEVDFFSIGTNDLIQYTTAVDRGNQKIAHLYNQFHPALLRLVKMTIENGHKEGIWVGMCGEVAGDPKLIPILAGMGLDEFSMSPSSILKARAIIRNISKADMVKYVEKVVNMPTAQEIEKFIDENIKVEY
jgi:phosphoenolpyruvate-protein phosphotransferase